MRLPSGNDHVDVVDASKALCTTSYDKDFLLGVVEAAYGDSAAFNKVLLDVLNAAVVPQGARVAPDPDQPSSYPQPPMPDKNPQPLTSHEKG